MPLPRAILKARQRELCAAFGAPGDVSSQPPQADRR